MKISALILKLKALQERDGDNEVSFTVNDFYSTYGKTAELLGGGPNDNFWDGTATNKDGGVVTIQLYLNPNGEGKNPKITFR